MLEKKIPKEIGCGNFGKKNLENNFVNFVTIVCKFVVCEEFQT